ncbi:hypothetical protein [Devosia chinhatensis]|uniref:Uncharacterized protein n=1 Tax=Devosia chinhatensis TaxID=429727 RepID=A0A0F5FKK2_9HYPH|nr:hypothetical protein [Devosia chinhatensis]KKB09381.1 hypothetical protein VE26_05430 [Devosia chinhatensis]
MAITGPVRSSFSEHQSKTERKYYLRSGARWLHWSGTKLTDKRREAWKGSIEQARSCRRSFDAAAGCRAVPVNSIIPTVLAEEA